ncbi:MAG: hypothetical protein AAF673_05855, partial [Pseudomonadota bacterium]
GVDKQKELATNAIESGGASANIVGLESAEEKASSLSSIRDVDLDDAGRARRFSEEYSFYDEGEFEPGWTKPGNKMHKEDADDIVSATAIKIKELLSKLQEAGVVCSRKKGAVQREPIYTIEVRRENQQNTEYDQFFCEEPRGAYRCYDTVTVRCSNKQSGGKRFEKIIVTYKEMEYIWLKDPRHPPEWERSLFNAYSCPTSHQRLTEFLINKTGNTNIEVPAQGALRFGGYVLYYLNDQGQRGTIQNHWHQGVPWNGTVNLYYTVEEEEQCLEWSEDWDERCTLQ